MVLAVDVEEAEVPALVIIKAELARCRHAPQEPRARLTVDERDGEVGEYRGDDDAMSATKDWSEVTTPAKASGMIAIDTVITMPVTRSVALWARANMP